MPIEVVTKGLETTSDKIRALAHAGYLRTEIAQLLDIRYQHVRKVLVDAGIDAGLQRTVELTRSTDIIEAPASDREPTPPAVLLEAGFSRVGEWTLDGDRLTLSGRAPAEVGVYAFILDDEVVYVGVTQNGLQVRMEQYRRGHAGQKTNARVNALIREGLAAGHRVSAMTAVPASFDWNGLPVDGAAGLEAGLIRLIQPRWNMRGRS
ncbi:GIY-YIG nuclease family protein [Oharaeibacter diazotrophicus]|uniref:GIY-YIG nuclease family protein n=1 Tax=Oharaeibacter diazotrophicus TaxID=1920512 RepID=UPI001A989587|nr:GIY-YIG nuclease family protein [Oharaeibacter diazotrophicus]